jgi:hypothetical protein
MNRTLFQLGKAFALPVIVRTTSTSALSEDRVRLVAKFGASAVALTYKPMPG